MLKILEFLFITLLYTLIVLWIWACVIRPVLVLPALAFWIAFSAVLIFRSIIYWTKNR